MSDIIDAEFVENPENLPAVIDETQIDIEYAYAKNNLVTVIEKTKEVLMSTAELAIGTDHPQIIEVYMELVKTFTEINKDIFKVREQKMKLTGELNNVVQASSPKSITNNAIFVGSSEELLKKIKNL